MSETWQALRSASESQDSASESQDSIEFTEQNLALAFQHTI